MPTYTVLFLSTFIFWMLCVLWIRNSKIARVVIPPILLTIISQYIGHYGAEYIDPFALVAAFFTLQLGGAMTVVLELLKSQIPVVIFEKLSAYKIWVSSALVILYFFTMIPTVTSINERIEQRKHPEIAAIKAAKVAKKAAVKAALAAIAHKLDDKTNIEHRTIFYNSYDYYEVTISVSASDFARVLVYQKSSEIICVEYFQTRRLGHYNRDFTTSCHDDLQFRRPP